MIMATNANSFVKLYIKQQNTVLVVVVSVVLSMVNLTFITLDRLVLVAVKWLFFYENRIQAKHIFAAIDVVWGVLIVYGIVLAILSILYDSFIGT